MKKLLALTFLLLGSQQLLAQNKWIEAPPAAQSPQLPAGKRMNGEGVRVIDGDTIRIGHQKPDVRLVGFNAPETRRAQCEAERRLGDRATARLRDLVRSS